MESNLEKIHRYLQDIHALECGIEQMVLIHSNNQRVPETTREICREIIMRCRVRQYNIEERLSQLGSAHSVSKDWMDAIASQLTALWNAGHDNVERLTMDLVKIHASGHLLLGSYCALLGFTDSIGEMETKTLAEKGMREAKDMADSLLPMIDRIARYAPVPV